LAHPVDCVVYCNVSVRHFDDPASERSNARWRLWWHRLFHQAGLR